MTVFYISHSSDVNAISADDDMTPKQKDVALAIVKSEMLMPIDGGYPDCAVMIGDHVVIARADDNGRPDLSVYTLDELMEDGDCFVEDVWDD